MTASPETVAYLKQVRDYDAAADRDGTEPSNPPQPPTPEVAMDASAAVAKIIGLILDYQKTGRVPRLRADPGSSARRSRADRAVHQQRRSR